MTNEELIKAARESVEHAAQGAPDGQAARIRAGEADDDRLRLLVQLANALEETTCESVWEYGVRHSQGINACRSLSSAKEMEQDFLGREHRRRPEARGRVAVLRRRAAGPWEPVDGENDDE